MRKEGRKEGVIPVPASDRLLAGSISSSAAHYSVSVFEFGTEGAISIELSKHRAVSAAATTEIDWVR